MRRIIERKVTVVTTTTWTITWQDAPPHPQTEAEPVPEDIANTDAFPLAPTTPDSSAVIEIKEADSESSEKPTESNPPARETQSYLSNSERK